MQANLFEITDVAISKSQLRDLQPRVGAVNASPFLSHDSRRLQFITFAGRRHADGTFHGAYRFRVHATPHTAAPAQNFHDLPGLAPPPSGE